MSSTKKDPSFCVAANDPHLVSLGGGRLSTAVTIHNIPIGDTTVGSSTHCSISLNGSGVLPLHCTIYRSEENEVTLVPEREARILIDGSKIVEESNLTQGAMITLGKSYYMRFNNPAEAHQIRSAMGSYERVSMSQMNFSPSTLKKSAKSSKDKSGAEIDAFYESTIQPELSATNNNSTKASNAYANLTPIDINAFQCPKVFTADLVTVNMPAEDVLGQRYNRFAKNTAENHRNEKNMRNARQNNNDSFKDKIYDNVQVLQHTSNSSKSKHLVDSHRQAATAYDRYPKLGNMQIFPMNSVNNEINTKSTQLTVYNCLGQNDGEANANITSDEKSHLDDMLKICTEYTDRQNQNTSNNASSPIVQNRIKTNGSLPREKRCPFTQETQRSLDGSYSNLTTATCEFDSVQSSSGYENVRAINVKRMESQQTGSPKENYESVVVGKYVPQSPRTKIRTNCMSPKRDQSFSNMFNQTPEAQQMNNSNAQHLEYDELLRTFGEKLEIEMMAIEESSHYRTPTSNANSPHKPSNLNKNNLKLNLKLPSSLQNSPKLNKKPAPAPRTLIKNSGGSLPQLSDTTTSGGLCIKEDARKSNLHALQEKIHRLEAQRNATRVMEENQQAKLKQSIEMKSDQVKKLRSMLKENKDNECLKDELKHISESLDNDRKVFEDLEFQYLEEESEWHAYHEELKSEERQLKARLAEQSSDWDLHIRDAKQNDEVLAPTAQRTATGVEKPYNIREAIGIMSQSLFGSAEILCPKRNTDDVMSRSVNENMFFNNKIEVPSSDVAAKTSTPKRPQLQVVAISDEYLNRCSFPSATNDTVHFNLTLGNDDFEVNPLEKRVPSQDDIDRISKVTSDAPISSTQGANTKIFDSIKEIERNRQLLLAQQGHHVIEHERQKMNDLKKKSHSEARAQYLSMLNRETTTCVTNANAESQKPQWPQEHPLVDKENHPIAERTNEGTDTTSQQRHSQPELESNHFQQQQQLEQNKRHSCSSRPLSEANSELSCDLAPVKSNIELTILNNVGGNNNNNNNPIEQERSSSSALNDPSANQPTREQEANERKRILPKHQRPLTRYLPIFSPDLDLRQHIETAGHQIALCPHVFVDTHSCRGYLHKLGATFHGWSKRWFVLDRQRNALIYYSDKLERKPRGGAYFSTIDEVYLDHLNVSKSGRPHCTFIVKTKKRSYQLQAASDAAARIWIDAIITGAQGNLDY